MAESVDEHRRFLGSPARDCSSCEENWRELQEGKMERGFEALSRGKRWNQWCNNTRRINGRKSRPVSKMMNR